MDILFNNAFPANSQLCCDQAVAYTFPQSEHEPTHQDGQVFSQCQKLLDGEDDAYRLEKSKLH